MGIVIQSYLRRSAADIERLIAARAKVRLCKGAYSEPATVAFPDKRDIARSYVELTERLLRSGQYHGIATHDAAIIEQVKRFAKEQGIGPERFEFQMLYGIRRDLQNALRAEGYNVRVYVPFGTRWYPYFMRRLAESPVDARLHPVERPEGEPRPVTDTEETLGGYQAVHGRPPAFEGSDGRSYSAGIFSEDVPGPDGRYGAAVIFVRWSPANEPDGHLETGFLAYDADPVARGGVRRPADAARREAPSRRTHRRTATIGGFVTPVPLFTAFQGEHFADPASLARRLAPPYDVIGPVAAGRARGARSRQHRPRGPAARAERRRPVPGGGRAARGVARRRDVGPRGGAVGVRAADHGDAPGRQRPLPDGRVPGAQRGAVLDGPGPAAREDPRGPQGGPSAADARHGLQPEPGLRAGAGRRPATSPSLLAEVGRTAPWARCEAIGATQEVWIVAGAGAERIATAAGEAPVYIADGHHRFETSVLFRDEAPAAWRRGAARTLAHVVSFRDPGLAILPTHRIVQGAPLSREAFLGGGAAVLHGRARRRRRPR